MGGQVVTTWGEAHNAASLDAGLARIAAAIRALTFVADGDVVTCGRCGQRWGRDEFGAATLRAHKVWCRS